MRKPRKKGVPSVHTAGILKGLPRTDAVHGGDPEKLIIALEAQIADMLRVAADNPDHEATIKHTANHVRADLLETCVELMPQARKQARKGKPALLRLISRIARSAR